MPAEELSGHAGVMAESIATPAESNEPASDRPVPTPAPVSEAPRDAAAGDYFLQSPRIHGAWLRGRIQAVTLRRQARSADVLVTLDGDGDAKHEVVLTMVLDNGTWKIRHVNRAALDAAESSISRAAI